MPAVNRRVGRTLSALFAPSLVLILSFTAEGRAEQTAAGASFTLEAVNIQGLSRYAVADVQRVSRLTVGQTLTTADLGDVANRLARTGLFKTVRYTYNTKASAMVLTFVVEEHAWTVPVLFDNFVWFTDGELTRAVATEVPSFDGTVPDNQDANELVREALQKILDVRKIAGRVEFITHGDLKTAQRRQLFSIRDMGPALQVCTINLPGASEAMGGDIRPVLGSIIGSDYSRMTLAAAFSQSLERVYRQRGYLKVEIGTHTVRTGGSCPGVTVAVPVKEGMEYLWDGADWSGSSNLPVKDLNAALGMKPGEPANLMKIDLGLDLVHAAYGKIGYLQETATAVPTLDDATRKARFAISVVEGPQFRMGAISFLNVTADDEQKIRREWKLKPGDVYNTEHPVDVLGKAIARPPGSRGAPSAAPRIAPLAHVDAAQRIVNVQFVVK